MTIKIIDIIKQQNDLAFPVADSNDLLGGFYQVETIEERNNIPSKRRRIGMMVYVEEDEYIYQLKGGLNNNNWEEFVGGGVNGAVFITDINPINNENNVGSKVYEEDGKVLQSCVTDTDHVEVSIFAITGNTNYKPLITIKEQVVSLTEQSDSIFTGSINIDLQGEEEIIAIHEDGAIHEISITHQAAPEILSANFTGGYPANQTELKEGDTFGLYFESDINIISIEVDNEGACKYQVENFQPTTSKTITMVINDMGDTAVLRGAKIRVQSETGSWSQWYYTDSEGAIDGVNVVNCNNLHPSISVDNIAYPGGLMALKGNEVATVYNTVTDFDQISYFVDHPSIEQHLDLLPNLFTIEEYTPEIKVMMDQDRDVPGYNTTNNNFMIYALREANHSESTEVIIVNIADEEAYIEVQPQFNRLRSSPGGSQYNIQLISNQQLLETPQIIPSHGVFINDFTGGPYIWNRTILIDDGDTKGTHQWHGLFATNLAGTQTTETDNDYIIGGFKTRRIFFDAFSAVSPIGTYVTDTSKLDCVDIGGNTFTYQGNKNPNPQAFTIVNHSQEFDPNGNYIYIVDENWVSMNSGGDAYVDLQELV